MRVRVRAAADWFVVHIVLSFVIDHGLDDVPADLNPNVCAADPDGCGPECQTANTALDRA